ncbi:hypothetical protein Ccrd_015021 [Cynara cardunculus var. scolymus]|uniref:Uncharacterized protein n=1 Tax=Cynara cardunculus var. scolymus TaxID=59895 RepID=A0A118K3Y9_CYNCS|nr:hypothetical protein Ccrd_015021 [Cynara cardunculus var. scolymus]
MVKLAAIQEGATEWNENWDKFEDEVASILWFGLRIAMAFGQIAIFLKHGLDGGCQKKLGCGCPQKAYVDHIDWSLKSRILGCFVIFDGDSLGLIDRVFYVSS